MLLVLFLELLRWVNAWEWTIPSASVSIFFVWKCVFLLLALLDFVLVSSVVLGSLAYIVVTRAWRPLVFSYSLRDFDEMYGQPEHHPRDRGKLPPVFLNGWHLIGWVDEFSPGVTVKKVIMTMKGRLFVAPFVHEQVRLHSRELVLFRAADGSFGLLDAFCPHMGADLSVLGTVEGCALQCPFHHWQFSTTGECTNIPYLKSGSTIPAAANTKAFRVKIFNRAIFTWWDAEGREPWFEIDDPAVPVMPPDFRLVKEICFCVLFVDFVC